MPESLIKGVSDTAFMVAAWRAAENARPDALFRDPFAARLAGEHGHAIAASMGQLTAGGWQVVIRTVIIDEMIQNAVAAGTVTILNLGAGLDARPYRLTLPASLRWIEVDYPHVIDWKTAQLADEQPHCRLERVRLDLADRPARQRLFAEIAADSPQTLILTEGVVPYLTNDAVGELADDLHAFPGRAWIVDYFSAATLEYRRRMGVSRKMSEAPFRFEPPDWFEFFAQHGWRPAEVRYVAPEGRKLGRPIPLSPLVRLALRAARLLAPASKSEALQKFAGYVILKPGSAS